MGRLVILHYHLNPGGVTRIIESQVQALTESAENLPILVMTGHCPNPDYFEKHGIELILNEKLNYLPAEADFDFENKILSDFFRDILQPDDILHFHNLNLGKNPVLTCVIGELVEKGFRLINHAHDFAEDRPENYKFLTKAINKLTDKTIEEILYPQRPNFIHAVLNSTDQKRLLEYGVNRERIYLLPNPVAFSGTFDTYDSKKIKTKVCSELNLDADKKLISYPVRVIRRKNIGEYILLCWLFRDKANWLVTQAPKNPVEIEPYEKWKQFCRDEEIPLVFEAGTKVNFEELLRASDFCFTTSIQEGFGMVYMEPWLMNTSVIGRNLQNITEDLKQSGINFPLLYDSLNIVIDGKVIDFGSLPMQEQMDYIYQLIRRDEKGKELWKYNSFLKNLLNSISNTIIIQNKTTILEEYSLDKYGQRLKKIYKELIG